MDIRKVLFTAIAAIFAAPAANAYFVSADPAQFSSGTDLTHAFDGMTLETWQTRKGNPIDGYTPLIKTSIFSDVATVGDPVIRGQSVFGPGDVLGWGDTNVFFRADYISGQMHEEREVHEGTALVTTFDEGSSYVEVVGGARGTGDYFLADFYDTDGNFMGRCRSVDSGHMNDPVYNPLGCKLVTSGTAINPDNAYTKDLWTITWHEENRKVGRVVTGGYGGNQYVRSIYAAVPEPSSLAVLTFPMLLIGFMRKKRNAARNH